MSGLTPDTSELDARYKSLTDPELLKLAAEGGFTGEAGQLLQRELARRKLSAGEAKRRFAPEWLDEAEVGAVGKLVLTDGKQLTAQLTALDYEEGQVSVYVIADHPASRTRPRESRTVPFEEIISFQVQPRAQESETFSDPCRNNGFKPARFAFFTLLFLLTTLGSIPLFLSLKDRPFGFQVASLIVYTLAQVFFTFAHTRGMPPFMLSCPAVLQEVPELVRRHWGFLLALFGLQTALLTVQPHLPDWWNVPGRKGGTAFEAAMLLGCIGIGVTQVYMNRSILERAHQDFPARNGY